MPWASDFCDDPNGLPEVSYVEADQVSVLKGGLAEKVMVGLAHVESEMVVVGAGEVLEHGGPNAVRAHPDC